MTPSESPTKNPTIPPTSHTTNIPKNQDSDDDSQDDLVGTGWRRLANAWKRSNSTAATPYLGRAGNGEYDETGLYARTEETKVRVQWLFQDAGDGTVRIRNRWLFGQYLTRGGDEDGPSTSVFVQPLNMEWMSQRWKVERNGDGYFIISALHPEKGYLTRAGTLNANGGWDPINAVCLSNRHDMWDSQRWKPENGW